MHVHLLSLFPESVVSYLESSMMKRAQEKGLFRYTVHNLTDWTVRHTRRVDDRPYGGGAGTIISIEPLYNALHDLFEKHGNMRILCPSPRGTLLDQRQIQSYALLDAEYCIICGHYEGIDERIFNLFPIEEVSIGNYVLSSGELGALVWIDSVVRLLPGVLSEASLLEESFSDNIKGKKEYPQYTRPEIFEGYAVPDVLLSGDQKKIALWKQEHLKD